MMDGNTVTYVKAVIGRWVSNCQHRKRLALDKKLQKLTKCSDGAWQKTCQKFDFSNTNAGGGEHFPVRTELHSG